MTQHAPPPWGQPAPAQPAAAPWGAPAQPPQGFPGQPAAQPAQGGWQPPPPQGSPTPPAPWGAQPAAPPQGPPPGYGAPAAPAGYGAPPAGYGPPPGYGQPAQAAQPFAAPMGGGVGDVLDGVATAKTRANNPWFPLGNFVVDIDVIKMFQSKDPDKLGHIMVVAECKIVWSDQATAVPGNTYSETLDLNKYGLSDWQNLITALYGGTPGVPEHIQHCTAQGYYSKQNQLALTGEGQPKRGTRLRLWTHMNKGGTFTKHEWLPMPPG